MANPKYKISVKHGEVEIGEMTLELFPEIAPLHCENFESLVNEKFYDGTAFHRVIPGFMIQGGDPNSKTDNRELWGYGDPKQKTVKAEFSDTPHKRGILSAARTQDPDSATSQFFICVADAPHLDGQYTAYGKVTEGMEVADQIVRAPRDMRDCPREKVEMTITKA